MKEYKGKIIENKVFTKKDIRWLWKIVNNEFIFSQSREKGNRSSFKTTIKCLDMTTYESETDDLLNDSDIIDTKKCMAVDIKYYDNALEKQIDISLRHGNSYYNEFSVVGKDKNWVSGTFDKINSFIESLRPQQHWFIEYKVIVLHMGALVFGFFIFKIMSQYTTPIENPSKNIQLIRAFLHSSPIIYYSALATIFWLEGLLPVLFLQKWALKLWPSVELDVGPEHQKIEKSRRKRLRWFFLIIIAPLLIDFISKMF